MGYSKHGYRRRDDGYTDHYEFAGYTIESPTGPFNGHATLGTGLTHVWLFDSGSNNFAGEVGGLTLTCGGSDVSTFPTGPFGRGIQIDGNSQEALFVNTGVFTPSTTSYTLAAVWENRGEYTDKHVVAFVNGNLERLTVRCTLASNDSIMARVDTDGGASAASELVIAPVGVGKWFLAVTRWNHTTRTVRVSYVKLTDSGSGHDAGAVLGAGAITVNRIIVGETGSGKLSAVDEVYVWNRELTNQEIEDIKTAGGY